jgi:hypothetical protein
MFDNLAKLVGLGVSFSFILALAHETIFLFLIGADVRLVPYEISDIVTASALMLPRVLGFFLSIILISTILDGKFSRTVSNIVFVVMLIVYLSGFYGKVAVFVFVILATIPFVVSDFPWKSFVRSVINSATLIGFLSIWVISVDAIAASLGAQFSNNFPLVESDLDPNGVFIIRSLSRGFILRDSSSNFLFADRDRIAAFPITRVVPGLLSP